MAKRNRNREGSIGKYGGRWVGRLTLPTGQRKAVYGKSFDEVREKLTAVQRDLDLGQPPTGEMLTIGAYLTVWLEEQVRPRLRPATYAAYRSHVLIHLIPALGRLKLSKATPADVERLMAAMQATGLTATTASRVRATLRAALARAVRQDLVRRNVAALAEPPRAVTRRVDVLTADEARRLLGASQVQRLEALVVLALATGLRLGELLGLRWDDVAPDCSMITVRNGLQRIPGHGLQLVPPKTNRSRRSLPVAPTASAILRAHRERQDVERQRVGVAWSPSEAGGFVFSTELGRPLDPSYVSGTWWPMVRSQAGLSRVRFHDLRHAAASFLLAAGENPRVVMEQLGHSQISLTMNTYAHVMPSALQGAADKMESILTGKPRGEGRDTP